jgi:hypothetical protein
MAITQKQFDNDPTLVAKAMSLLTPAANDSDILAADPAFDKWLDQRAMEFEIEHGDFYV